MLLAVVGAAYWLFRTFSERWLQSKFDARLAELQHAHNQEIEQLRFRINSMMDRTAKLHEREYQVLPDLWEKLASALAQTGAFTSPIQSYADVGRMSDKQLDEHLAKSPLFESQKQAVRDARDRTRTFQKEIYWHRKADTYEVVRGFSRSLRFNGIFVPAEISTEMNQVVDWLFDALLEHEMNEEHEMRPRERKAQSRLTKECKELVDRIEKSIRDRLWSITRIEK